LFFLSMAKSTARSVLLRDARRKRVSFLLVLASLQRWPEKLCRWFCMAAVASLGFKNSPQAVSRSTTVHWLTHRNNSGSFATLAVIRRAS
jgi:hypothetical protein